MKANLGEGERVLRILIGIILIALGMTYETWLIPPGCIVLLTGILGWCPLYTFTDTSTKDNE